LILSAAGAAERWDDIALTLRAEDKITTSRKASTHQAPWL